MSLLEPRCRTPCQGFVPILRVFICLLAVVAPRAAQGTDQDDSLLAFAVNIERTPTQPWTGYGVYLGRGFFITAAHVVGHAWLTRPRVVIGGHDYPTHVVKEGSFDATDLTVLSVDESLLPLRLRLRENHICTASPRPGEPVVSVVPEKTVRSYVLAPEHLPVSARKFSTVVADVAHTGNSGSGVFDVQTRCLLGIMSRKISQTIKNNATGASATQDIAKYFVPAAEIRAFLPPGVGL